MKFGTFISRVIGAPDSMQKALAGRSTKWIMDKFGVSKSTANRWKRGEGEKSKKRDAVIASAKGRRRKIAADSMRRAKGAVPGRVKVHSDTGRETGYRNIGDFTFDDAMLDLMQQAADAVEAGNDDLAHQLMDQAFLHTGEHGKYGPMHVDDDGWGPGFHFL